jgi:hypothetical protein
MLSTVRESAVAVAAVGALGLGGAAIAGAADNPASSASSSSGSDSSQSRPARAQRQPLSNEVAAKVKAAGLEKVPGRDRHAHGARRTLGHPLPRSHQDLRWRAEGRARGFVAHRDQRGLERPASGGSHDLRSVAATVARQLTFRTPAAPSWLWGPGAPR